MNELDKIGASPRVLDAAQRIAAYAAIVGIPFDAHATVSRLAAWETQSTLNALQHRAALSNRTGHPALRRR